MARPIAGWLVAAMLGLAACGGNGSAEPSTTSVVPSTTSPSTTTAATTTTTTTTLPVTTTISALDAEKAKVEAAYRAVTAAHLNALTVLDGYDPATIRAVYAPGPLLDSELQLISDFRNQGRRMRPNNPDSTQNTVESISLTDSETRPRRWSFASRITLWFMNREARLGQRTTSSSTTARELAVSRGAW